MVKCKINYKDVIIFMIPFIIFGLYLFIFFPGILSYDSYHQLNQINTNSFSNWHPFLHTFVEMICLKIWNSPASIGLFQILIFSLLWCLICKYNRNENSNKFFIFQIILTLIITFNPINAIFSITLWKDILFSYFILAICFMLQILIDRNFDVNKIFIFIMTFFMAFTSQIRYNGMYIMLIMLIVLSVIMFMKNKKSKNFIFFPLMFIGWMGTLYSLNIIYNVEDNDKDALSTKIMHVLAYYELKDYITDKDNKIIEKIISIDTLKNDYNPYFLDIIYDDTNIEMAQKYKKDTIKMTIKYSLKHPIDFTKYVFKSSVITWSVVMPPNVIGTVYNTDIETVNKPNYIYVKNIDKDFYKKTNKILQYTLKNKIAYTILYNGALYVYLTLGIIILLRKKNLISKYYYLLIMPVLLNLGILVLCIPVQDTRYIYPNFLITYLFLMIFINKLYISKKTNNLLKI